MKRGRNLASEKRRRKMFTILWMALLAIVTIMLLYWEKIALLYILATLGVTALLVVVARADLSHAENMSDEPRRIDDSAAIASGITRQS